MKNKMEKKEPIKKLVMFTLLPIFILLVFFFNHQTPLSYNNGHLELRNRRSENGNVYTSTSSSKLEEKLKRLVRGKDLPEFKSSGIVCDTNDFTEVCIINKRIIFNKRTLTIYIPSDQANTTVKLIKPYPRREDPGAMDIVSPVKIITGRPDIIRPPVCQFSHNVPAIMFSFAGYLENPFHAFNEIVIPVFLTSSMFEKKVKFVYTEFRPQWAKKCMRIVRGLSDFDPVVADDGADEVHCFPAGVVGVRYHDNLAINPNEVPLGYTMQSVRQYLWDTYNVKVKTSLNLKRPKVLLLSRRGSRTFLNEDAMVKMMEQELGLEVYRAGPNETSRLDQFAQTVNSCEIMVGAHGAGLTNALFLPTGAVMIQIVPLGLNWASDHYFGDPAPGIGLNYLRYKVMRNETSLYEIYGPDNPIVSDPASIWVKGYAAVKEAYVDSQNFRINLARFKGTLLKAIRLLEQQQSSP